MIDTETLGLLRDSLQRFASDSYGFEQRRQWLESDVGFGADAWRQYASLGWLALPLPEANGGFDGDPRAVALLMEYVGQALALEPVLASAVICGRLLSYARDDAAAAWRDAIASGEQVFALAHAESVQDGPRAPVQTSLRNGRLTGAKSVTLHGDVAQQLVVSARDEHGDLALCVVDKAARGVAATPLRLVDGRGAATLAFDGAPCTTLTFERGADEALERVLDEATLAMCAETLGAVRALNAATNDYLKTRKQFGKPIGGNQALQHRMVELYMLQEELQAVIEAAQRAWDGPAPARVRAVSAAAAQAASVGRHTAHEAVQMHGGMGITSELAVSHYFRRLMVTARLLGDREHHLDRFASVRDALPPVGSVA